MSRSILGGFGPESSQPQRSGASCGGVCEGETKDVMNYSPPVGPKGIMSNERPGLGGSNHGNDQRQNSGGSHSGSPGIGGTNHGCCGSQGRY